MIAREFGPSADSFLPVVGEVGKNVEEGHRILGGIRRASARGAIVVANEAGDRLTDGVCVASSLHEARPVRSVLDAVGEGDELGVKVGGT